MFCALLMLMVEGMEILKIMNKGNLMDSYKNTTYINILTSATSAFPANCTIYRLLFADIDIAFAY
jgi:hypothetical protein